MSDKPDGGPAFPMAVDSMTESNSQPGMTLRDYFSAAALPGLPLIGHEAMAKLAYQIADALIAERSRE